MSPVRIQLRRTKGWRKPAGAIVVSRPSKWGNPYRVGSCSRVECYDKRQHWHAYDNAGNSSGCYTERRWAAECAVNLYSVRALGPALCLAVFEELQGHDLACWCPLTNDDGSRFPCHADYLLGLADGPRRMRESVAELLS
jgi:hypothetical protein